MKITVKRLVSLLLGVTLTLSILQLPTITSSAENASLMLSENTLNIIEVANEEDFMSALEESTAQIIQLTQPIQLARSSDGKDNVFVINRAVTITGQTLSLERAGIILGADVVFENITLCFNTPVRNAIIANGHSLTINNVTNGGTYEIDLFCGGITDYNGGNVIPQEGSDGIITMLGTNSIGSNIYAGSLSDIGYADENGNPYKDIPNTYNGNATIILEKDATGFNKIYAHGARENRSGGHANEWLANAALYSVSGNVDIQLNYNKNITVDGATGGSKNATFIYKDAGNGYVCEPTLKNIENITLLPSDNQKITHLAPNTTQTDFNTLSIPANTRLSLVNMDNVLSAVNFEGGGELVFADTYQTLNLHTANGLTKVAVGDVDSYGTGSTGTINTDWICITVADSSSENEFVLMPNTNSPNIFLIQNENGNWITQLGESSICINEITIDDLTESEDNFGVDVPINVIYTTQDEMNFLGDIPIKISVNGKEAYYDETELAYFTSTTDSDLALFFNYGYDCEILQITNYDYDVYSVPRGRYEISLTIPANNMINRQEHIISFVLTVGDVCEWSYTAIGSKIIATCIHEDCSPKDMTILAPAELTYDGNAKNSTVENFTDSSTPDIIYQKLINNEWVLMDEAPIQTGTYKASITVDTATAYIEYIIMPCKSDIGIVSAENIYDTTNINNVILNRTNETIEGKLELTDTTLKYGTHDYTWKFTPQDSTNYESLTGTISINVIDTKLPTATYQIANENTKNFLNNTDINLFYDKPEKIEIFYDDEGSGLATKQYYISNIILDDMSDVNWKNYTEPFYLDKENIYFIYVRITDNYGNTVILNSEGIVIYTESTLEDIRITYAYGQNSDLLINMTTNGNIVTKLTDLKGNEIDTDAYTTAENGSLVLKASYLDNLNSGSYAYTIYMKPQGIETSEITFCYRFSLVIKKYK